MSEFNKIFEKAIVDACKDKIVLLTLTGGLDTRAILAVLIKNEIPFDALTLRQTKRYRHKNDVEVALKLGEKYARFHCLIPSTIPWDEANISHNIILTGYNMTEVLCSYEFINLSTDEYIKKLASCFKEMYELPNGFYSPMMDNAVLGAVGDIPTYKLMFSAVQVGIIKEFAPELLKYKCTNFSRKRKICKFLYNIFMKIRGSL